MPEGGWGKGRFDTEKQEKERKKPFFEGKFHSLTLSSASRFAKQLKANAIESRAALKAIMTESFCSHNLIFFGDSIILKS
jgi:hypothetical protein